jgi:ribonuclease J
MKIIPIGMNCMILETENEILIVDCGIMFSDLDHFGVEFVIPDFTYLLERKDKIKAYIFTHGHEDHIGALPIALKAGIHAPIYASNFTSLLINERLK